MGCPARPASNQEPHGVGRSSAENRRRSSKNAWWTSESQGRLNGGKAKSSWPWTTDHLVQAVKLRFDVVMWNAAERNERCVTACTSHMRRQMWLARGSSHEAKFRMLHLSVWPVVSWSAGCRLGTKMELDMLRTRQLCMTRRVLQLRHSGGGDAEGLQAAAVVSWNTHE